MIEHLYRERLAEREAVLAAKERTHARYAWARISLFAAAVLILAIGGWSRANWLTVPLGAFIVLAMAHARLLNARDRAKSAVGFYERGLLRVTHQWIGRGREGQDYADRIATGSKQHPYAADLDLFGRGSLFELLATTRTHAGEETLADWLLQPAKPEVVASRQDAVRELARDLDLRERVAVMGDELRLGVQAGLLRRWASTPVALRGTAVRIAIAVLVSSTLAAIAWWVQSDDAVPVLLLLATVQLAVAAFFKPRVHAVIEAVDEPAHDLDLLAGLLELLERQSFASPHLQALQQRIKSTGRPAAAEIRSLSRRVAMLASRDNVYFAIPAGLMMWATQWAFAIEAWRSRAGARIPEWLDVVGEFEALLALGTFAGEHSDYVYPGFTDGPTRLQAESLAHPLLGTEAVPNSLSLDSQAGPALIIVSGSNMSGKSTLLRAVGVNAVLAGMGAPVRAARFDWSAPLIGASVRVVDSLTDGRSRFFAEITRLKAIVDLTDARNGAALFLLDEILSGTNSHDRRAGAEALLRGLVNGGAIGLVTTHDLALGEIADALAGRAANMHFEDQFVDGALRFDYQLRPGIVKTSNALALMRSIGIEI